MKGRKQQLRLAICLLAVIGTLGMFSFPAAAQTYLFNKADFPTGTNPAFVATGDFNGDGRLDLVIANRNCPGNICVPGSVSILLGKPDGTFQPHIDYPIGATFAMALATGDFNGDGKLDLIVAAQGAVSSDGGVSVLLGNGDGTFRSPVFYNITGSGGATTSVATGDFNRDGKLDVAVADGLGAVAILLGNGDGTFQAPVSYTAGFVTSSVATGDFNGDGKLDLAVVNRQGNTVSILLGNGDGTFRAHVDYATGNFPQSVATGDFNGDGRIDLAVTNNNFGSNGSVSILLGNGDGTFQAHVDYPTAGGAFSVVTGEFNGDGKLDLAVTDGDFGSGVSVLIAKGDGTFQPAVGYISSAGAEGLATADVNGDGTSDLVVTNQIDNTVSVLLGNGDGNFVTKNDYPALGPLNTIVADLNRDGNPDLVASNGVLLGNGDGTFQPLLVSPTGLFPATVGDFNHDGNPDLAVLTSTGVFPSGAVFILMGKGDGTFQPHVDYQAEIGLGLATGDFTGRGNLDLAVADYEIGAVSVLLGNGDGTFQPQVIYSLLTPANPQPNSIAVSDLNGDAKLDIIVASEIGISILLGNGDGTFKTHVDYPLAGGASGLAVADFNKDGKPDLVTLSGGGLAVLMGNGDGTLQSAITYAAPANMGGPLVVADFNLDGKLDVGGLGQTSVDILFGNGDGTFQTPGHTYANGLSGGQGLAVADFNRDGALDLAGTATNNSVSVVLNSPVISLFPSKLSFGKLPIGTVSTAESIVLRNPGSTPLKITSITVTGTDGGDFAQANACLKQIPVGSGCAVKITFSPKAPGIRRATIKISDNAPGRDQFINVSGVGVLPAPVLSPTSLTYSDQLVGTSSASKEVKFTNTGNVALIINSIKVTGANHGDFAIPTKTCGSSLPAGASCTVTVIFKPAAIGTRTAAVTIVDDAIDSPQRVSLSGIGTVVSLSPSSLNFGSKPVGSTSASTPVAVKNNGKTTLTISAISVTGANSGDFHISSKTCGSSLAADDSCNVSVTFRPTATGARSATLNISDNGGGSPQQVSLSGTGTKTGFLY